MRTLSVLSLLAVAACGPAPSGLSSEAAYVAHLDALEAGDADRALALLDEAADAGYLAALGEMARAMDRGYLSTSLNAEGGATNLPIRTLPWDAPLAERRYDRALRDSIRAGHENALFLLAELLLAPKSVGGEWITPEADRDSARAVYRRLVAQDARPLHLALLADRLDGREAYLAHLDDGVEAGDPQACLFLAWSRQHRDQQARSTAPALAASIDRFEACRQQVGERDTELYDYSATMIGEFAAQARQGNDAAVATLDSLRAEGVLDRHPRLVALAEGA